MKTGNCVKCGIRFTSSSNHRKYCDIHSEMSTQIWVNNHPWYQHYRNARERCKPNNCYGKKGREFFLTMEDVKMLWFRNGASRLNRPSLDRIDNSKGYSMDNCRFIEWTDNNKRIKDGRNKPVLQYKDGRLVGEYRSIRGAGVALGVSHKAIQESIYGGYRCKGNIFKLK